METELNRGENYNLLEDYIFNQDNYLNEGAGGFTIKELEHDSVKGFYKANDFCWVDLKEKTRFVVALTQIPNKYHDNLPLAEKGEFLLNIYENEKLVRTLTSRSEIRRICVDDEDDDLIYGGLQNGRVVVWNLESSRNRPEMLSRPHLNSNFLSIVHIGNMEIILNFEYSQLDGDSQIFRISCHVYQHEIIKEKYGVY